MSKDEHFEHKSIKGTFCEIDKNLLGRDTVEFIDIVCNMFFQRICAIAEDNKDDHKKCQIVVNYFAQRLASKALATAYYRLNYPMELVEEHMSLATMDNIRKMAISFLEDVRKELAKDEAH